MHRRLSEPPVWRNGYPTTDGKPMAETDLHRDLMVELIQMLQAFFAGQRVYVSGNLLVFFERGNRRRHVSPDVFVVKGARQFQRPNYLVWEERPINLVIELTSSSTRREDTNRKFELYRDVLRVREYFLFDPYGDHLDPQLQGYRLTKGEYRPVRPVEDRLPSKVLGLHFESAGETLRLYNPDTGLWLPTPAERIAQAESRLARGVDEARALEAVRLILRQGQKKFGPPAAPVRAALSAVTDLDRLEALGERLLDAASWEQLLGRP